MAGFRDVRSHGDVAAYQLKLANGYPERTTLIALLVDVLVDLGIDDPHVAELCVGPGDLAAAISGTLPHAHYVGLDFMDPFLAYTTERLPSSFDARFVQADLTGDAWPSLLSKQSDTHQFDAIVSMQSFHDVGDLHMVQRLYRRCLPLLSSGGILLNADLIAPQDGKVSASQGRLSLLQHLQLLTGAGFSQAIGLYESDNFVCCKGVASQTVTG